MTRPQKFQVLSLEIPAVLLISARQFADERGWFSETYSTREMQSVVGLPFVQENEVYSRSAGTLRGLHFQVPPHAQAKLVRVVRGAIYDVAVDLRAGSPTYGHWCARTLDDQSAEQMFIPGGFAHGYCTLVPETRVIYKVDDYYAPECEQGLSWNDPDLAVVWPPLTNPAMLSPKDRILPRFAGFKTPFAV